MTLYKIAINVFIVILDLLFLIPPHNLLQGVIWLSMASVIGLYVDKWGVVDNASFVDKWGIVSPSAK